jgi:hypothetical protein
MNRWFAVLIALILIAITSIIAYYQKISITINNHKVTFSNISILIRHRSICILIARVSIATQLPIPPEPQKKSPSASTSSALDNLKMLDSLLVRSIFQFFLVQIDQIEINLLGPDSTPIADVTFSLSISKKLNSSNEHMTKMFGNQYTSGHEYSLHISGLKLKLIHEDLLYSEGFVSLSLCFAKENQMLSTGIFFHLDNFNICLDTINSFVNHPFAKELFKSVNEKSNNDNKLTKNELESPVNSSNIKVNIQRFMGLIFALHPRVYVKCTNLTGFQKLRIIPEFKDCNELTSIFMFLNSFELLLKAPDNPPPTIKSTAELTPR